MRESHVSLVLLLAISVLFRVGRAEEANLVTNAGFESAGQGGVPEGWAGPVAVYSRDEAVKRSGAAALKFVNPDAKTYALCKQPLDLKPGCRYELSAWVKTEGVVGEDSGATVCLEWHTADGKYVGGQYPAGLKGNTGWKQIHSISGRVPEDGNRCYVLCYVRKGMTGTAWWDDVRVVRHREPPLSSVLRVPNYRGLLTDSLKEAHVRAYLNLVDHELKTDAVGLRWSLRREGEEAALKSGEKMPAAAEAVDLTIPAAGLAPGDYEVSVSLVTLDAQKAIGSTRHRLVRPAVPLSRRACIDEHQRLIHDGKPFFPLGMYWSGINEADLNTYADSAFNCLMPYGMPTKEQMDLAHARGLKVIYSVKDAYAGATWCPREIKTPDDERPFVEKRVTAFRDHPALLACI